MRQLAFAGSLLAIASLAAPAAADSEPVPCRKPVVWASIPANGMTDVPIDTIAQVWVKTIEVDCANADHRYWLTLVEAASEDLGMTPYVELAQESGTLPESSQATITMQRDTADTTEWSATFTTGSALAAPPVAPSDATVISYEFLPLSEGSQYQAIAHVRIVPANADPFTSAVLTSVGSPASTKHVPLPGADGSFDVTLLGSVQPGEKHCVRPGLQNAAGKIAYGEPLCATAPVPAPESGCSIGTAARGNGGAALVGLLVGVAGAVVRRVRRRHDGTPLKP